MKIGLSISKNVLELLDKQALKEKRGRSHMVSLMIQSYCSNPSLPKETKPFNLGKKYGQFVKIFPGW